jgi:septal ring factor EnvC (AmiA/AmiB activator)
VDRVTQLERALQAHSYQQEESLAELGRLRQSKLGEVAELRSVERDRQSALEEFQTLERQAQTRLEQLDADENRLTGLIDDLERRRLEEERRRALSGVGREGPSTLSGADAGSLDWPVEGDLIYRFGRERRPNGTVLRWNGIGIQAATGTPVRAVKSGRWSWPAHSRDTGLPSS